MGMDKTSPPPDKNRPNIVITIHVISQFKIHVITRNNSDLFNKSQLITVNY